MAVPDVVIWETRKYLGYMAAGTFLLGLSASLLKGDDVSVDGRIVGLGGLIGAGTGIGLARRLELECTFALMHFGYGSVLGALFATFGSLAGTALKASSLFYPPLRPVPL